MVVVAVVPRTVRPNIVTAVRGTRHLCGPLGSVGSKGASAGCADVRAQSNSMTSSRSAGWLGCAPPLPGVVDRRRRFSHG